MKSKGIVAVIPARGGSKGILGKNLVEVGDKPMIAWSIEAALSSEAIDRLIVSTDSEDIARVARDAGAEVPFMRPSFLALDEVHAVEVVLHVLDWLRKEEGVVPEGVMMLLPTSPLRRSEDIQGAVELFRSRGAQSVVSVVDLGKYMTNLRYMRGEQLEMVDPSENRNAQRQGLEKLYSVNGSIFLARTSVLIDRGTFHVDGALGYKMDAIASIDINEPEDLFFARQYCDKQVAFQAEKDKKQ